MFKNKHVIVALIVAPILAILSYLGVDQMVSEKPHSVRQDITYPLAAKSGCRYASGECRLENGDVKILLKANDAQLNKSTIELVSELPIKGAKIAIANGDDQSEPVLFLSDDKEQRIWHVELPQIGEDTRQLRLVVFSGETVFFAEVSSIFLQPTEQTSQR